MKLKKSFIGLTAALILPVLAQAGSFEMTERTKRHAMRMNNEIQTQASLLDDSQLMRINEYLRGIEQVLRGGGAHPIPPQPVPQPIPQPPPSIRYIVAGSIENSPYSFQISNLAELHDQCVAFVVSNNISSVDDISVSINFGQTRNLRNGADYWRGANTICQQVILVARESGISYGGFGHTIIGTIESRDYKFSGWDLVTISNQCTDFVNQNSLSSVDDITLSVDFGPVQKLRNGASYWQNSFEICQQILQQIRF
jgi:hypothetical protein